MIDLKERKESYMFLVENYLVEYLGKIQADKVIEAGRLEFERMWEIETSYGNTPEYTVVQKIFDKHYIQIYGENNS